MKQVSNVVSELHTEVNATVLNPISWNSTWTFFNFFTASPGRANKTGHILPDLVRGANNNRANIN